MAWFMGLMSGTSLDGVDAALAWHGPNPPLPAPIGSQGATRHLHLPMPAALRKELLALNTSGADEIHRSALAANALVAVYAEAVRGLLQQSGLQAGDIVALAAHGQTVRHRPSEFDGTGYTVQLMNGALLAEACGIDVVCDFRSRDVAAGGQGAPLVPAFHAARFAVAGRDMAVLNLGGIANLSLLRADGGVLGFDTGPGNVLMDLWCQRVRGLPYDAAGAWAASGQVDTQLLMRCLADPYFSLAPPKSSGRDRFNTPWLEARLSSSAIADPDLMATLAELTVHSVVDALQRHAPATTSLLVCGGGAGNTHVLQRLQTLLGTDVSVRTTDDEGTPADQVEALAFAWLAHAFVRRQPGNVPTVTGARGNRILGALYPA